jgi:hypothetical protein
MFVHWRSLRVRVMTLLPRLRKQASGLFIHSADDMRC